MLSFVWLFLVAASVVCAIFTGSVPSLGPAAMDGASGAVELCISLAGPICLWCGVMRVAEQSGAAELLRKAVSPVLGRLMPGAAGIGDVMRPASRNVASNLLGLGNAATPSGLEAARELGRRGLTDELRSFVLLNTASIQLIPTTIASIRSSLGCADPFDILPAVWFTSAGTLAVALLAAALFRRFFGRKGSVKAA